MNGIQCPSCDGLSYEENFIETTFGCVYSHTSRLASVLGRFGCVSDTENGQYLKLVVFHSTVGFLSKKVIYT